MKIALLSPSTYSTPALGYGGETYFHHLSKGLHELGHHVTLYASPGSLPPDPTCPECRLRYIPGTYGAIDLAREHQAIDWFWDEIMAHDFVLDAMHNHLVAEDAAFYHRDLTAKIAVVLNGATTHTPRCGPYNTIVGSQHWKQLLIHGRTEYFGTAFARRYPVSIEPLSADDIAGVVLWGTDTNFYTPGDSPKGSYLYWLSHPEPYKGLPEALEVAVRTRVPLVVSPSLAQEGHRQAWQAVQPSIKSAVERGAEIRVEIIPETGKHHQIKRELMRRARALLFPVQRAEAFGLVVIEALACGTPVITSRLGAMPEIVRHGETGFLCKDLDALCQAVKHLDSIDPRRCREDAVERFHYLRAAREYVALMEESR